MVDEKVNMGRMITPMVLGIGGIAALGMGASVITNMMTGEISGAAHDAYGNGVEGVLVSLNDTTMITGSDGAYAFRVSPGSYSISFSKTGYYSVIRTVQISRGVSITFNVPMEETVIDPTGTVLCLPMSEGTGIYAMDVSGYDNDGLLEGGISWATLPDGRRALSLDGISGFINCGSDESILPDIVSVMARVKFSTTPAAIPFLTWALPGFYYPTIFYKASGAVLVHFSDKNFRYFSGTTPVNLYDGGEHTLVLVITGSGMDDILNSKLYVDGYVQDIGWGLNTSLPEAKENLSVGRASASFSLGLMAGMRLYNRALSITEGVTLSG